MIPPSSPLRVPGRRLALGTVAVVALLCLSLAACSSSSFHPPAAQVGSDRITDSDLQQNIPLFKFLSALGQQPCGRQDTAAHETAAAACARFTLTNLIQEHLIDGYAAANGVSVAAADVKSTTSQLETRLGGHDKLMQFLAQQHVTFAQLQDLTKRLLLFNAVRRDIASGDVSSAQLHQTYEQSKVQYVQIHAAHILVQDQRLAEKISKQVNRKNFADLAKKYSIDKASAKNGGDIGTQAASQLDQTFVQTALSLKPGEISKPVQTQFGWRIIMLIDAQVTPFKQVKAQLLDQASAASFNAWLTEHLRSTTIRVNPRYGRLNPDSGQVDPITSTATGTATPTPPSGGGGAPAGSQVTPSP